MSGWCQRRGGATGLLLSSFMYLLSQSGLEGEKHLNYKPPSETMKQIFAHSLLKKGNKFFQTLFFIFPPGTNQVICPPAL